MAKQSATDSTAAALSAPERILLFCIASGTAWEKAVTATTPQHLIVRDLIDRDRQGGFRFTDQGRAVLTVLIDRGDR